MAALKDSRILQAWLVEPETSSYLYRLFGPSGNSDSMRQAAARPERRAGLRSAPESTSASDSASDIEGSTEPSTSQDSRSERWGCHGFVLEASRASGFGVRGFRTLGFRRRGQIRGAWVETGRKSLRLGVRV